MCMKDRTKAAVPQIKSYSGQIQIKVCSLAGVKVGLTQWCAFICLYLGLCLDKCVPTSRTCSGLQIMKCIYTSLVTVHCVVPQLFSMALDQYYECNTY